MQFRSSADFARRFGPEAAAAAAETAVPRIASIRRGQACRALGSSERAESLVVNI